MRVESKDGCSRPIKSLLICVKHAFVKTAELCVFVYIVVPSFGATVCNMSLLPLAYE